MKRFVTLLLLFVMSISLVACGGKESSNESKTTTKYPTGIWVLMYYGDENGEYVEEFNKRNAVNEDVEIISWACENYGNVCFFRINQGGKAIYHRLNGDEFNCEFDEEKVTIDGIGSSEYKLQGDKFVFEDPEFEGSYLVMVNTNEKILAKMQDGCYGTVDLKDAKIGDLVALGKYEISPGNDKLEWIKWRVLDKDGDNILIICEQLIDSYAYNTNPNMENLDKVNWKDSTCRAFLNNETDGFLSMFNEEERELIQVTHNENKACNRKLKIK